MAIVQIRGRGRKPSGGRYKSFRGKKKFELGRAPALTGIGARALKRIRTKGGGLKMRVLKSDVANLYDPKTKTFSQAKIKTVVENPADSHYVRRNIMNKGTVIDTDKGRARVTSRPGQHGTINAVLIS